MTNPFVLCGLASATVGVGVAGLAWSQRDVRGARVYALLMMVLVVWSLLYVGQLLSPTIDTKRPWLVARHAISPVVSVVFWWFTALYIDRPSLLSARYMLPIVLAGFVVGLLPIVNPAGLYWVGMTLYTGGSMPRVAIQFGPGFGLFCLHAFVVVGGAHGYIVSTLRDSFSVYRRQLAMMAVVGMIEFGLLIAFLTEHLDVVPDLNPWPHVQLVTYNMIFVAVPLGWSYVRESLFSLRVLDRAAVIRSMEDAVFIFDTDELSLQVESTRQLTADPRRLQQVFENLFQNTVTHGVSDEGDSATTVRVDSLPDGFYIEDDGPGIQPTQRTEIFEYGMSTADGSGFGLAIVRTIIQAHGWEIDVTDGSTGGARFEISIEE